MDAVMAANQEQLLAVPDTGPRIAESVVAWFADNENRRMVEQLRAAGLQFAGEKKVVERTGDTLEGKTFLYSGTFANFGREELETRIAANGGKVLSGISKKLNYLIVGENAGPSKVEKARKLNVPMISEDEFMAMLSVLKFTWAGWFAKYPVLPAATKNRTEQSSKRLTDLFAVRIFFRLFLAGRRSKTPLVDFRRGKT